MSIWPVAPVDEQPHITLERWRVLETEGGERLFVGYCVENREGRVSTAIVSFDAGARVGTTKSGRRYLLSGWPCFDGDAELVWGHLARSNRILEAKDVSMEYTTVGGQ
jgi:hypothetical protein